MIEVTLKEGEQIEHALRRFKKKWERAGVLRELRKKNLELIAYSTFDRNAAFVHHFRP